MHTSETHLSSEELIRYSRQILLPGVGLEGQQRLKSSKVLVIGMGGLGSPAAYYLAAAGIGHLGLVDMDKVELSNLHRQILHSTDAVEVEKVESARQRLSDLNPNASFFIYPEGIDAANALNIIKEYDLIVDGSDNFPTRYLVADAAYLSGKPLVYGAVFQFEGQSGFFNPSNGGPCYRCLFPRMPDPASVPNCAQAGVFGALCGIIGSLQALSAIKYLAKAGDVLQNQLCCIDALSMQTRHIQIKKDPQCPLCGSNPSISDISAKSYIWNCSTENNGQNKDQMELPIEISVEETRDKMAEPAGYDLLDVREPFECEIASIQGSIKIPLGELPSRFPELSKTKNIIVYCHHGMRSLKAAQFLREHGLHAQSMRGGIDAWSININPDIKRY